MLTELTVQNFALLEDVRLELSSGFTVLTGETGAGKSIILDALGLVLGRRADAGQIRQGAERLTVTARFEGADPRLKKITTELGLENEGGEGWLVRRDVDVSGRSRAFVNDQPVSVAALSRLGEILVYIHGQNEHQTLLKSAEQRILLDDFSGLTSRCAAVALAWDLWKKKSAEADALVVSEQEQAQRLDLYRFQKKELDGADVRLDEEEEWNVLLPQLKNAEQLQSVSRGVLERLSTMDSSALDSVRWARVEVDRLVSLGAPVREVAELLDTAAVHIEEVSRHLDSFASSVETDPARLDEVLARLDLLARLKKKYGPTLADVMGARERVTEALHRLENLEGTRQDLARGVAEAREVLVREATALSNGRRQGARRLAEAVQKELPTTGLPLATFQVGVTSDEERLGPSGWDHVEFMFAANPGEGKNPLALSASGGELSRVMLALETVLSRTDGAPVLIFDEIDSGVGGSMGAVLGKKLASLGRDRQVVCITHLATLAACGNDHWTVTKEVSQQRTRTVVHRLTDAERVTEIARLVGSPSGGDQSLGVRHAQEMLKSSHQKISKR